MKVAVVMDNGKNKRLLTTERCGPNQGANLVLCGNDPADPEHSTNPPRHCFTLGCKSRIVEQTTACIQPEQTRQLPRRDCLCSSIPVLHNSRANRSLKKLWRRRRRIRDAHDHLSTFRPLIWATGTIVGGEHKNESCV